LQLDGDALIKSLAKGKADIVITGKISIEGEALSLSITTYVIVHRNEEEKSRLVTINAYVRGIATKVLGTDGEKYNGDIIISENVLVFIDPQSKEVENAISSRLQSFIEKITSSSKTKPKFFVVH